MLELEKKHNRGKKTLLYLCVIYGWWLSLIGIGFIILAWLINFGSLQNPTANFLANHPDWYITTSLLGIWIILAGISLIFIAYLRASVYYKNYKFILDEYAVHLHKGIFFIRETTIPYQQITNVHIDRPYHYRILGIAQLDIITAADRSAEKGEGKTKKFFIPIIDVSIARKLARQLLESGGATPHDKYSDENIDDDGLDDDNTQE